MIQWCGGEMVIESSCSLLPHYPLAPRWSGTHHILSPWWSQINHIPFPWWSRMQSAAPRTKRFPFQSLWFLLHPFLFLAHQLQWLRQFQLMPRSPGFLLTLDSAGYPPSASVDEGSAVGDSGAVAGDGEEETNLKWELLSQQWNLMLFSLKNFKTFQEVLLQCVHPVWFLELDLHLCYQKFHFLSLWVYGNTLLYFDFVIFRFFFLQ